MDSTGNKKGSMASWKRLNPIKRDSHQLINIYLERGDVAINLDHAANRIASKTAKLTLGTSVYPFEDVTTLLDDATKGQLLILSLSFL